MGELGRVCHAVDVAYSAAGEVCFDGEDRYHLITGDDQGGWRSAGERPADLAARVVGSDGGQQAGDLGGSVYRSQRGAGATASVVPQRDVGGEHVEQVGQAASDGRVHEPFRRHQGVALVGREAGSPCVDVSPRPVDELAYRGRSPVEDPGDLVVLEGEGLLEDERGPFEWRQRFQDDQQAERDAAAAFLQLVGAVFAPQRFRQPRTDVLLPQPAHLAELVDRPMHDDAQQIRAGMLDRREVDLLPAQPRLLYDVLGVRDAAEDVVRRREQQVAVRGENSRPLVHDFVRHAALTGSTSPS